MKIGWGRLVFIMTFEEISYYIDDIEDMMEKKREIYYEKLRDVEAELSVEDFDDYIQQNYDELVMYRESYFNISRRSTFLTLYSLFEKYLFDVCKMVQIDNKIKISIKEFATREKGIFKAKEYLKKHKEVSFPANTNEWSNITKYNIIRNNIAHEFGEIKNSDEDRKLMNAVKDLPKIYLKNNEIILEKEFNEEFYNVLRKFSHELEEVYF